MSSHRRKLLPLCIAASLLTGVSLEATAIGVGEIHLQSFLGSPLQAEIPLSHLGDLDAGQLKVKLGTQSDYSTLGVDYTYLHSQLKIEPIVKNGEGYVRISTREPIAEPYLNFVLSLQWPQGQLVREFTVLLDPPTQPIVATSVAMPESESFAPAVAAATPSPKRRQRHRATVARPSIAQEAQATSSGSYVIQRGDSLWRIANKVRSAQASTEQVMVAIQALNPNAFINGNPNLLKEAATIALPDAAQIASAMGASPAVDANPAAAKVARPVAPALPAAASSSPAVEQLVAENSSLKTQIADLTSNVSTLNQSLEQSGQRMHQLESQLNELLLQMQQQRATVAALSGTAETHGAAIAQSTGSVISQVNASELRGPAKAHTPLWVHLLYWLGIGAAATWAVREHFWPQRRLIAVGGGLASGTAMGYDNTPTPRKPRPNIDQTRVIETAPVMPELTLDLDTMPAPIAHEEPAPQLLRPSDEPVDASISAGVFVAFGRFGEAEDLLRSALVREPKRMDLKLQLLDVLMQSDQPGAFDDLAAEIESEAREPETLAELAVLRESYRPRL